MRDDSRDQVLAKAEIGNYSLKATLVKHTGVGRVKVPIYHIRAVQHVLSEEGKPESWNLSSSYTFSEPQMRASFAVLYRGICQITAEDLSRRLMIPEVSHV